jgi:hypothetical protein
VGLIGALLVLFVLWEGFETIIFPRRVTRKMRITRLFYGSTWGVWSRMVHALSSGARTERYLSFYGPLSLLFLLSLWAGILVFGFAMIYWAANQGTVDRVMGFGNSLYLSGTNFFTLGIGDVLPHTVIGRLLTVVEAGLGFGFLALVIGYLPALNQSFSRREVAISMLDARAGSPPTAGEMLRRHTHDTGMDDLCDLLVEWERWSAEVLESHLSYPVLAYFRSHHDNQSWLSALSAILDTCAVIIATLEGPARQQAELTFAMARHAVVDLAFIFNTSPREPEMERLRPEDLVCLREDLAEAGIILKEGSDMEEKLKRLRHMYEPYVYSLADHLRITIPRFVSDEPHPDNWQTSAWGSVLGVDDEELLEHHWHKHF